MSKAIVIKGADFAANALDQVTFDIVHATAIELSDSSIAFTAIGATKALTYTLTPSIAEDAVRFTSSNEAVATVTNGGVVTVTGCGTCTITAIAGSVADTCAVSVEVELTGYSRFKKTQIIPASASNRITSGDTVLGTSATTYSECLACCVPEMPYEHLMCYYKFTKKVDGTYVLITDSSDLSGGELRFWNQIGYPVPIMLPANTSKIRFESPDALHGVYPLFFKHDVPAYEAGGETINRAHYSPYRHYEQMITDSTFIYATSNEVSVPEGYDSVIFTWRADKDNSGKLFTDMTDDEIAAFKAICI